MAIIRQYHKDTDTTYVYESTSYWDAEKQQSRSRRKLLGKLDPVTGDIIPTGSRGRKKKDRAEGADAKAATVPNENDIRIQELALSLEQKDQKIRELELENQKLRNVVEKLRASLGACLDLCSDWSGR